MVIIKTYRRKLYRCNRKTKHLDKLLGIARNIYNHCIALDRRYYKVFGKHLSAFTIQKHITKLKQRDKKYWCILNAQAIQEIAERIDKGYKLFFVERKRGNKKISIPEFKGKNRYRSITFKNTGWKIENNTIKIQGKTFKFNKDREITGKIRTITVKKDKLDDWWIFISVQEEISAVLPRTGKTVGLDFGLKTFLTTSDGDKIQSPEYLRSELTKVRKLSRKLSRKVKGSSNRKRARLNIARIYKSISNKRDDWQWKIARNLVENYDVICVEDLNIKAMHKLWGRKIGDLAISEFYSKLEYLCKVEDKKFVQINRWYPSSKTCHCCGHVLKELSLDQRTWTCPKCETIHDRDKNAAKNIEMVGTSTIRLADVRLHESEAACA